MPVKKAIKKPAKATAKKTGKKAAKKKTAAKTKKGQSYECQVCGYKVVVDEACGCVDEHVFICCDKPMKTKRSKKA